MTEHSRAASPFRLNLEQQRKRAKALLRGWRAGDPAALARLQAQATGPLPAARLSEAQRVVARELGLPSWPRLTAHVAAMQRALAGIGEGGPAPDAAVPTLHLRCGSDIRGTLQAAGFAGDFLEYSDPLCQGPVLPGENWLEHRAGFLAQRYGAGTGRSAGDIAADLAAAERGLAAAAARYPRIVLWFEHDSYDQLILARCLAQFAQTPPARLELVAAAGYPGSVRFIGLGQMPPEALRLLWRQRVVLGSPALQAGQTAWALLRAADPRPLAAFAAGGTPALPQLARGLQRHCQEFPWTGDGLGLTERLLLQILAERPRRLGEAYATLMMEREPLPWLTDLMILAIAQDLRAAATPLLEGQFTGEDRSWPQEWLRLTPAGAAVLDGRADWQSLAPPARWLGGTAAAGWRWDPAAARLVAG